MRTEDQRLLTGKGCYSADAAAEGAAWAVGVRSPYAHADIRAIDIGEAKTASGVLGVFTGADLVTLFRSLPAVDEDYLRSVEEAARSQPLLPESPWEP